MANASEIVAAASALSGTLRIFQVNTNTQSATPMLEWPTSYTVPWQPPLYPAGSNSTLLAFSAVCYIMGSTLSSYLGPSIPIGLLHSAHGGTSIQAWQSPAGANQCGDNSNSWNTSVLYNSNVHPMTLGYVSVSVSVSVSVCVRV